MRCNILLYYNLYYTGINSPMSERYGTCRNCPGENCIVCGGSGFTGDAICYLEQESEKDWPHTALGSPGLIQYTVGMLRADQAFYKGLKSGPGIKAAIAAVEAMMDSIQKQTKENEMSQDLQVKPKKFELGNIESVFIKGDISQMNEIQRIEYTREVCRSLGLNPLTNPFDYISFQGKVQLYAKKGCTDQLRSIYGIALNIVSQTVEEGILTVTVRAKMDEREDEDVGCVSIQGLKGDALCNAKMKAVTKAKRRVTLSICGLGMLDETETESIPGAKKGEQVFKTEVIRPTTQELAEVSEYAKSLKITPDDFKTLVVRTFNRMSLRDLNFVELEKLWEVLKAKRVELDKAAQAQVAVPPEEEIEPGADIDEEQEKLNPEVPWAKYRESK
jgi:hypothetical protein